MRTAWGEQRIEGPGKRIPITEGQVLDKIDLRLTRTGVVTGKILDEPGDPATDVGVTAMRYRYVQGARRLMPSGRSASTNDIGEFRVYGLTPGQYYLSAMLRNINGMGTESTDRSGYAATFFPGTGNVAEAQRLAIAPGQTIPFVTITLLPIQTARVGGIALDLDGKPLARAMINVMQRVGAAMVGNTGAPVRPDGRFSLNLAPGEYTLRAFGQGGIGADSAFTELTVTGSDIDDRRATTRFHHEAVSTTARAKLVPIYEESRRVLTQQLVWRHMFLTVLGFVTVVGMFFCYASTKWLSERILSGAVKPIAASALCEAAA